MCLRLRLPVAILFALGLIVSVSMPALAQDDDPDFASPLFEDRWARTDLPVAANEVDRSWIWGPGPNTNTMLEPYAEAPNNARQVQYFDKARMEINDPTSNPDDLWAVTNGLLVVEMVDGKIQTGDSQFDESPSPANVPIAGDLVAGNEMTYAKINQLGLRDASARAEGTLITETVSDDQVVSDDTYADYGVTAMYQVDIEGLNHTVASPFWGFMTQQGLVYEDGNYVTDNLFRNPFYATGYPITEAYWTTTSLEGQPTDILWQCFQRRCLTYTPDNPEGWEVEAGNVGLHYYDWRYGEDGHQTRPIEVALYDESGATGDPFGCEDGLVPVDTQMQEQVTIENEVRLALQRMFNYDHPELSNFFLGKPLSVHTVGVSDGVATIWLVGNPEFGGVCDEPRFEQQINVTAMQFEEVNHVEIMLNGESWEPGQQ